MHVAFINPQGNFDPEDSYWTAHPDFGGQLVYVKELALAMGNLGHRVDIVTRRVVDPNWPEFESPTDAYPEAPNVRILRIPCGPDRFLPKEELWPYLGTEFVPNLLSFYEDEGSMPDAITSHYGDGGLCAALIEERTGVPFSFTAHSLGAQKMDKMGVRRRDVAQIDEKYHFSRRIVAERLAMNRSRVNVTSTGQERFVQYTHNAYRGAVDPTDGARFAAVPPGVAMHIFDRNSRTEDEEAVREHVRSCLARDLAPERLDLPCVVASSRLDPKKNHLSLVEAFASSPTLRESANLVILTGNMENPLEDYRDADEGERTVLDGILATIERARMRGMVSMFAIRGQRRLAAAYRSLSARRSVFALTANYEPFGLAPLEAMAAGLPAVVTKNGGPSESLREGDEEYGVLVDPGDPEEVAAGLYAVVGNADRWRRYAEAGYGRVLAKYTWERTAEGYLRAIAGRERDEEVLPDGFPTPSGRLEVPAYFTDPGSDDGASLETLDALYFGLDVLAVGESLVDFISHEFRISLRTAERFSRYLGGQPANVAVYVAKLGGRSAVITKVGTDYFGEFVEDQLGRHGVSTEGLHRTPRAATTNAFVTRTVNVPDFQVNRGADALLSIREVPDELIERARAIHTSAFALSSDPQRLAVRRAMRLGARLGKVVSLDPNYDPRVWPDREEAWEVLAEVLPYVTVVKPSLEDARRLFDPNMDDDALEEACLDAFHDLGANVVVMTRSGGAVTVSEGSSVERVGPLPKVHVQSVTGARDAFWSALLVSHLDGKDWTTGVRFAHEVAALKLGVEGHVGRMIDREAIYERLEEGAGQRA
ncbi:glycosyltransferase [Rubrobacter tropicus]|uniref:sucrose-phosphate synthase n=1 Tax=Rubrobacter tropicus TaxID=2653851 RepID=A0A6G8Q6U1_9ACTN|nr:PfkB family carbohydrate kinase [Rubrobacter tropicus]QIN82180.1 glycosyltransferase [Rubrobacter tropicus]